MLKENCPNCNRPTISIIKKMFLGPARSITCDKCGGKVSVSRKGAWKVLLPYLAVVVLSWQIALILLPLVLFLYVKFVPLEKG